MLMLDSPKVIRSKSGSITFSSMRGCAHQKRPKEAFPSRITSRTAKRKMRSYGKKFLATITHRGADMTARTGLGLATPVQELDDLVRHSLEALAADPHVTRWRAKENNWVSYFVMKHLLRQCRPDGILADPAQVGIEVSVLQPDGYARKGVRRDIVIWPSAGATCWNDEDVSACKPLTILEWKVHRPRHKNRLVKKEREWLRKYCKQNEGAICYAVEVEVTEDSTTIYCFRFPEGHKSPWLKLVCGSSHAAVLREESNDQGA